MHNLLDQSIVVSPESDTDSPRIKSKKRLAVSSLALALVLIAFSLMWLNAPAAQASVSLKSIKDNLQLAPLSATLTVTSTADSGPGTLRDALATASDGDTINFSVAANSIITLTSGELTVNTSVTIDGSTATNLIVSGNGASRVFNLNAPATLIGFTITRGKVTGDSGGGLSTASAITLTDVSVINNSADVAGGMYAFGAVTLNGGLFQTNAGWVYGGGLVTYGNLTLTGTQFIGNKAFFLGGGGAVVYGPAVLNGGLFQNNDSAGNGGALNAKSALLLTGTQFVNNSSSAKGNAIYSTDGPVRIVNALFNSGGSSGNADVELEFPAANRADILHSTFVQPLPYSVVAIHTNNSNASLGITDTIIASYTTGIDGNNAAYEDYNLFYGNSTDTISTTGGIHDVFGNPNFVNVDVFNGDYHLQAGSAAINKGANVGVSKDIDGQLRCEPFDIGYDEYATCNVYLPLVLRNF
jgi:predicted outer membrane repeat protein